MRKLSFTITGKRIIPLWFFHALWLSAVISLNAQESQKLMSGRISFVTTQNVYAKFQTTRGIHPGDTVFRLLEDRLVPLFRIESISSVSCSGKAFDPASVKVDDDVFAKPSVNPVTDEKPAGKADEVPAAPATGIASPDPAGMAGKKVREQDLQGSVTVSSYSNLSNSTLDDSHRMRYTLSMKAANLANSRISAESYVTFSHRLQDWADVQDNLFHALKIYSLALKYELGAGTDIWAGRRINPKLSNIGAVDGLQTETAIGQFTLGAVAGSRPDNLDYRVNPKLLEYGGYVGHTHSNSLGRMQSSIAFFEQRNAGFTDRRFAYLQHDNALLKNLYFFTSCELDLYRVTEGIAENRPSLTSLYLSLRYRVLRELSLFASYDSRRNVIYYETDKGIADRLLDEATRQGFHLKINYRPGKQVSMGLNGGFRVREQDVEPNKNLNGFFTINQVPWLKAVGTVTVNLLKTSYLNGQVYGIRLSRDLIPGKLNSEINYRFVNYTFNQSDTGLLQNIAQANISWQMKRKISFSLDYELTIEETNNYQRIYISFAKRF
jgi:hypothetical protein